MKKLKKIVTMLLVLSMTFGLQIPTKVQAAPAPTLTKVEITDMTVEDTTGEIYVEVTYTGRPGTTKVTCNDYTCKEDIKYRQTVFKNGVEVGEVSYFKTQYTVDDINGIQSFIIYAEAQTLQYPRKTLYANRIFSI